MKELSSKYLSDILAYLDKAQRFTQAGQEVFYSDEMAQLAVIRVYEVIGEIVKRLPEALKTRHPQVDWRQLAGFRDFLAHNYDEIILEFLWTAIQDLPRLKMQILSIFASLPSEDEAG